MERTIKYKRILLKLSGESLGGADGLGIHPEQAEFVAKIIADVRQQNVDVAIVIGAGNLWRGRTGIQRQGDGPRYSRLHGYAGYSDECPGADGRHGTDGYVYSCPIRCADAGSG